MSNFILWPRRTEYEYTLSILFAGLTCCPPALGVASPLIIFAVVALFAVAFDALYKDDPMSLALFERECCRNPCANEIYTESAAHAIMVWNRQHAKNMQFEVHAKTLAL